MSLIANKVVAKAVKSELTNNLFFGKMASVIVEDKDLMGAGVGDTKQFTAFELGDLALQTLAIGDEINSTQIDQSSYEVKIDHLAFGKEFFDAQIKSSISGNDLDAEAVRQIGFAFGDGLDNINLAALTANSSVVDASAGITTELVLSEAEKKFGEKVYDNETVAALVVHPTKAAQLRNDPNFEKATMYEGKQFGSAEIGRLYGVIPVVLMNKTLAATTPGEFKNILVPKASVLSVIGKDLNVERERIQKKRAWDITADLMVGVKAIKEGIVFEG